MNNATCAFFIASALFLSFHSALADPTPTAPSAGTLRFATYNISFYRDKAGQLLQALKTGNDPQALRIAEVIRRVRPDVILLNEVDYDPSGSVSRIFRSAYLERAADDTQPLSYPYDYTAPVNTGLPTPFDLDNDGQTGGPADAYGYGRYEGQYGMVVLSRFPIRKDAVRTFQKLLWKSMPGTTLPTLPDRGLPFYDAAETAAFRLSSKSFWDVPIETPQGAVHLLCSHPTPPGFDGPEDRNGLRNFDEIRLVADFLSSTKADYLIDDQGVRGGLARGERFVVAGDLNADPVDGNGRKGAIQQLLNHERVDASFVPTSKGAVAASAKSTDRNGDHQGDPSHDTADFGGDGYSNLRVDYVLPSKGLSVEQGGVFWPLPGEPGADAITATDHRLVWLDLVIASSTSEPMNND